jgi:N-succinyldiaminopimelate aminotransferase
MTPPPSPGPPAAPTRADPLVARMHGYGTTIFAEMSELAVRTASINLGQGFPDRDGPEVVRRAAIEAIGHGGNQYPPGAGVPELRRAISDHQRRRYGLAYDPDGEVLVTAGATEAIAASLLALCEAGDEVVAFEPFYDSYAACTALAGAVRVPLTLRPPAFRPDLERLGALIGPRTRVLLVNSPHNPTGMVLTRDELAEIARLCVAHDLVAVTDEVYEHLVYDGEHFPLATFPGMRERTLTISSAGKTFSLTGWKIGWVCGPPDLVAAVRTVKQFLTYVSGGPFQPAVAVGLDHAEELVAPLVADLRAGRDLLSTGLAAAGFAVHPSAATYFVTADAAPLGATDGLAFCRDLPARAGVVAIPNVVFYDNAEAGRTLVRFAFCKRRAVLEEAVSRLANLAAGGAA